jgi:hypothetical protein
MIAFIRGIWTPLRTTRLEDIGWQGHHARMMPARLLQIHMMYQTAHCAA